MVACNRAYESKISKVKSIIFDAESDVTYIKDLQVVSRTSNNITLKWNYDKPCDGFIVAVAANPPYPSLLPRLTHDHNITITNLAPGTYYTFKVWKYYLLN